MLIRKGGWGSKFQDFRRESLHVLEGKAAQATGGAAIKLWNSAKSGWLNWAKEYSQGINRMNIPVGQMKSESLKLTARLDVFNEAAKSEKPDAALAIITVQKVYEADLEKIEGRAKLELEVKLANLKALAPELKKLSADDMAAEAIKSQAALATLDKDLGEQERKITGLKSVSLDLQVETWRSGAMAQLAVNGMNQPALAKNLETICTAIVEFEKKQAPLPSTVKQKLHDLIAANEPMKAAYTKVGGTDSLKAPRIEQP